MLGKSYKKELIVEGMHCNHCANKVIEALQNIKDVKKVKIDLSKKSVIVISKIEISNDIIKNKIEDLEYKVIEILE